MKTKLLSLAILTALSAPAFSHEAGDFIVRVGAATVAPNESSGQVATFGEFAVDDNTQLGLNFTYMVTNNFGVELLAATPFSHEVTLPEAGVNDLAKLKHLPPTLMAQYYFGSGNLRPYIGAGVNMTVFFDEKFTNDLDGALSDLDVDTSFGLAGQVGIDYKFNDNWLVNASVWYIDIGTDVNFNLGEDRVSIKTDIDPWVYMLSVGYTF
ncbi:OmpW family protein [Ferrimonas balearica DSM 9799]|uniref:Outer membrane protein W n=1 Tax=Ferrimonas balearica (strain DSM 9799 / CCM 4581 / KCTC 23876 / PAT) TaxID=550540 RepID=E1SU73_FERBD|nr:outer membrane protein OmpW [Ferrimonas balearica]ADN75220.1 OmpW family protein [Ferrimonas balearica DSM 9799]MBY5978883.1 outer membrane protein OmpW [Ferrimonas balearica]